MAAQSSPADIDKAINNLRLSMEEKIRGAVSLLGNKIVMSTPVLTGQARGNWILTYNGLSKNKTGVLDKSGEQSLNRLAVELEKFNMDSHKSIWLTNTLPYIIMLEYGWSNTKAPNGMVRKSLLEIKGITGGRI